MESPSPSPLKNSQTSTPRRTWRLQTRLITLAIAAASALLLMEGLLRVLNRRIQSSDQLDPGLAQYDARLGWSLSPSWQGAHQHADFKVQYHVDPSGFRADPNRPTTPRGRRISVLGDSFTFGTGVNDGETFVSQLNRMTGDTWWNYGVPGFSTDQEVLLLESEVLQRHPTVVLLVVYLGNDLLDNPRPMPLQLRASKPYFVRHGTQITLTNVPVPIVPPQGLNLVGDLSQAVLGTTYRRSVFQRAATHSSLMELLCKYLPEPPIDETLPGTFQEPLALWDLLIQRALTLCQTQGSELQILLLTGRSAVDAPRSISARYQNYLRVETSDRARKLGLRVIDAADYLQKNPATSLQPLYHPREGHLTSAGHQSVAQAILRQ